ncbi:hypothetical protein D0Z07_4519 [Hyphodiscus hymeniophilus]|uniref:Uncharacterized protein n=1 Tax=Hyphodiscus hymeniophilus TaxID=353542 RepID=A0A9P6VJG2_9HELO|nr:hypothetical protein D0Z07_4519 [Hyphodiscus hymeniophilus]
MSSSDQTINIPQLILILLLGGLAVRYFFFSSSPSAGPNRNDVSAGVETEYHVGSAEEWRERRGYYGEDPERKGVGGSTAVFSTASASPGLFAGIPIFRDVSEAVATRSHHAIQPESEIGR